MKLNKRPQHAKQKSNAWLLYLQDLQTQFSEERTKLQAEKDAIQAEFERVKVDLLVRCKQAEDEVGFENIQIVKVSVVVMMVRIQDSQAI